MNIEKLDTLLRSKLQWVESEVHDNELNAVFEKMGIRKKRPVGYYGLGIVVVLLCIGLVAYMTYPSENISVADTKIMTPVQEVPDIKTSVPEIRSEKPGASHVETKTSDAETRTSKATNRSSNTEKGNEQVPYASVIAQHTQAPQKTPNVFDSKESESTESFGSTEKGVTLIPSADIEQTGGEDSPGDTYMLMNGLRKNPHSFSFMAFQTVGPFSLDKDKNLPKSKTKALEKFLSITKPELSFWVSPMMSFENSSPNTRSENRVHKDYFNRSNSSEKPIFTMNSGFKVQFRMFSFLNIGTGIGYFRTGNTYQYDYRINDIPIWDSAKGVIIAYIHLPDSTSEYVNSSGRHISSYIEIPLSLQFKIITMKKFSLGLEPAYTLQILKGGSGEYIDPASMKLSLAQAYKTRSGNIQLGIPISYMINNRTTFSFSPYYGRSLQTVSGNINENRQRTYAGIRLSLNYKLYNSTK